MADTRSLRFIGMIYGAFTSMIALVAITVVAGHISGKMSLDDSRVAAIEMPVVQR